MGRAIRAKDLHEACWLMDLFNRTRKPGSKVVGLHYMFWVRLRDHEGFLYFLTDERKWQKDMPEESITYVNTLYTMLHSLQDMGLVKDIPEYSKDQYL